MMNSHTKHYFRAIFLLIAGVLLFFTVRAFLIPPSFGRYGFYRGDNVEEQMNHKVKFANADACATVCHNHDDIWKTHQNGPHAKVKCQVCHDLLSVHVDEKKAEFIGEMPKQRDAKLCLRCHLKLPSRPQNFPQIDPKVHLADVPEAHKPDICFVCHSPHDPKGGK